MSTIANRREIADNLDPSRSTNVESVSSPTGQAPTGASYPRPAEACDTLEMQTRDIVVIALDAGIRLTEAAHLRIEDVNDGPNGLCLRICGNTTPPIRWVAVPPRLRDTIRGWLERANAAGRARLFEALDGGPLDPAEVLLVLVDQIDPDGDVCLEATLSTVGCVLVDS